MGHLLLLGFSSGNIFFSLFFLFTFFSLDAIKFVLFVCVYFMHDIWFYLAMNTVSYSGFNIVGSGAYSIPHATVFLVFFVCCSCIL